MSKTELRLVRPSATTDQVSIDFMHKKLAESGLVPEDIGAYPVRPGPNGEGAFLIPYNNPSMYRIRYDRKLDKYKQPKGLVDVWYSHRQAVTTFAECEHIYVVEGELKAAAFVKKFGLPTFGIGGCWNFRDKTGSFPRLLADLKQAIRKGSTVHVIFDADVSSNHDVQAAASTLSGLIEGEFATAKFYCPPVGKGVDDWLLADLDAELSDLVEFPLVDVEVSRKALYQQLDIKTIEGKIILNEDNAYRLIKHHWRDALFNDRRLGILVEGEQTSDIDKLYDDTLSWMQRQIHVGWPAAKVITGFRMALRELTRDGLQESTAALEWDGVPRLGAWASEHFESDYPSYTNEWGRILMTGMTLRILYPGTKFDYACILVGPQGIGKSTFFEELATFNGNCFYTALTGISTSNGDSNRTQGVTLQRAVIVDLAEGVIFESKKSSIDLVKQFISQRSDEYREVYARTVKVVDRGFVFVGTTNRFDQLGDQTGSRRFLNIAVTKILRLPYLTKLQIMAEVVARSEEILKTDWWVIKAKVEDAPARLRNEATAHITDAQQLVNTQFHRADAAAEFIENLLDQGQCAVFKATGQQFISATYAISQSQQNTDFQTKNLLSRTLSAMSQNPTARYHLELKRCRVPQLEMDEKLKLCYTEGITNNQAMLVGYLVTPKT